MPAQNDSYGRRRGRGGSGRGSGTLGRGGSGGGSRGHHNHGGRRRGRGARVAAEESEALVEPVAQLGATVGPSRLLNVPAGVEGSSNGRGVRRLRESVTSETEEPPSSRIRTRDHLHS